MRLLDRQGPKSKKDTTRSRVKVLFLLVLGKAPQCLKGIGRKILQAQASYEVASPSSEAVVEEQLLQHG